MHDWFCDEAGEGSFDALESWDVDYIFGDPVGAESAFFGVNDVCIGNEVFARLSLEDGVGGSVGSWKIHRRRRLRLRLKVIDESVSAGVALKIISHDVARIINVPSIFERQVPTRDAEEQSFKFVGRKPHLVSSEYKSQQYSQSIHIHLFKTMAWMAAAGNSSAEETKPLHLCSQEWTRRSPYQSTP